MTLADAPLQTGNLLAGAPSGASARIAGIGLDAGTRRHLAALGIRSGAVIEVVRNLGADGVVIGLAEDRLSLPRALARAIRVAPVPHGQPETRP